MIEGNISEFTAPFRSYTDPTEKRCDLVAKALPEVKAGVGEFPDTVNTVGAFRFCDHIFPLTLKCKDQFYIYFTRVGKSNEISNYCQLALSFLKVVRLYK